MNETMNDISSNTTTDSDIALNTSLHLHYPLQRQTKINNTEIISISYTDRHFVTITQLNKFGTLIEAKVEYIDSNKNIYHIQTLFGKRDDPLLTIYARQIIENIAKYSNNNNNNNSITDVKPLLLSIALDNDSRDSDNFTDILNKLFEIATWIDNTTPTTTSIAT